MAHHSRLLHQGLALALLSAATATQQQLATSATPTGQYYTVVSTCSDWAKLQASYAVRRARGFAGCTWLTPSQVVGSAQVSVLTNDSDWAFDSLTNGRVRGRVSRAARSARLQNGRQHETRRVRAAGFAGRQRPPYCAAGHRLLFVVRGRGCRPCDDVSLQRLSAGRLAAAAVQRRRAAGLAQLALGSAAARSGGGREPAVDPESFAGAERCAAAGPPRALSRLRFCVASRADGCCER